MIKMKKHLTMRWQQKKPDSLKYLTKLRKILVESKVGSTISTKRKKIPFSESNQMAIKTKKGTCSRGFPGA
jgi:hypothetical protein